MCIACHTLLRFCVSPEAVTVSLLYTQKLTPLSYLPSYIALARAFVNVKSKNSETLCNLLVLDFFSQVEKEICKQVCKKYKIVPFRLSEIVIRLGYLSTFLLQCRTQ